jgi:hypothetical protein
MRVTALAQANWNSVCSSLGADAQPLSLVEIFPGLGAIQSSHACGGQNLRGHQSRIYSHTVVSSTAVQRGTQPQTWQRWNLIHLSPQL